MDGIESVNQPRQGVYWHNPTKRVLVIELERCPSCSYRTLAKLILSSTLAALFVTGFVLQLVGCVRAYKECFAAYDGYGYYYSDAEHDNCTDTFRAYFWTTSFQMTVYVVITVLWLCGVLKKFRVAALAFLVVNTVLLIQRTESSLNGVHHYLKYNFLVRKNAKTAAAGYIISAAANFILFCLLGSEQHPNWRSAEPVVSITRCEIPSGSLPVGDRQPLLHSQVMAREAPLDV